MVIPRAIADGEGVSGVIRISGCSWTAASICNHEIAIDSELRSPFVAKAVVYPSDERVDNHNRLTVASAPPANESVAASKVLSLSSSFPQPSSVNKELWGCYQA
jgi:hypothetical protein